MAYPHFIGVLAHSTVLAMTREPSADLSAMPVHAEALTGTIAAKEMAIAANNRFVFIFNGFSHLKNSNNQA